MNAVVTAIPSAADRARRAAVMLALGSLVVGSHVAAQEQAAAQQQTAAVLKLREVDFFYRSSVVELSCSELQGRVASILVQLGARQDVKVDVNGCDAIGSSSMPGDFDDPWQGGASDPWHDSTDPWHDPSDQWGRSSREWGGSSSYFRNRNSRREQSAHVRARAMMPVEVTPEVIEEIKRDKSRRELVSRVTGNPAAAMDDPIVFPAQRQLVSLSRRTIDLEPEECQLVEQMARSVFPKLDIDVVHRGPTCSRDRVSHIPPQMTVEALMPVMPTGPQLSPGIGTGQPAPGEPASSGTKPPEAATGTPPQ